MYEQEPKTMPKYARYKGKGPWLTERQMQVVGFIEEWLNLAGYPPTVRDIGLHFDIRSPNGVMCHLKALEKKGVIKRCSFAARAITIVGMPSRAELLQEVATLKKRVRELETAVSPNLAILEQQGVTA